MKCLSIRNPWAWAIVTGKKDVENRAWSRLPYYRGPLLIHASKRPDEAGAFRACAEILGVPASHLCNRDDMKYGGVVGVCYFAHVVKESPSPWFFGPLGLVLQDAIPLPFTPLLGQLGLFDVDVDHDLCEDAQKELAKWGGLAHGVEK